jgi:hypothetical protein
VDLDSPSRESCVLHCVTVTGEDELDWLPPNGALLAHDDLAQVMRALRALISGTEPDEPNRAHAITIAFVVAEAIDRAGGST